MKKVLNDNDCSGVFNISSEYYSYKRDFRFIKAYLNLEHIEAPIKPIGDDDVFNTTLYPQKTIDYFDWHPKANLKEIIAKQLASYDKKPIEQIYSHLKNE